MPEAERSAARFWGEAENATEREEVYSFRYANYFKRLAGVSGVERARCRVYLPHDDFSVHLTGRNAAGELVIVGSGTRASIPELPESWHKILRLVHLAPLGLDKILIYSKLVEVEGSRGSTVFLDFFKSSSKYFTSRGCAYSIHYCAPPLVPLYERLGYRLYGRGVSMPGGLYRLPMLLAAFDAEYLGRVYPAFREAIAGLCPAGDLEQTLKLLPELTRTPLGVLTVGERLAFARGLLPRVSAAGAGAPDLPRRMEKVLRRSALLGLEAGDSPMHPADAPLLWFVLEGSCLARLADGSECKAGSGCFINGSVCAFTALETSRLVLCTPRRFNLAAKPALLPFAFWEEFCAADIRRIP